MKNQFVCPKCSSYLNIGEDVILAAEAEDGRKGLIMLHADLGNYSVKHNTDFEIPEGMRFEFHCPVCHMGLACDVNPNLSKIHMTDPENQTYEVLFSKIAGEKSTYCLVGETVNMYGQDSGNYVDFINLSAVK